MSGNLYRVIEFLASDFVNKIYTDPANTNNPVSNDLTLAEKRAVQSVAQQSLHKLNWNEIVW